MDEHDVGVRGNLSKRVPHRILALCPTRHHLRHFGESMPRDDLVLTIFNVCRRNGKNDLVDHGSGLQGPQRLNDERLTTQRKKLFGDGAAHPKPAAGSRHERHHQRSLTRNRFDARRVESWSYARPQVSSRFAMSSADWSDFIFTS